MLLSWSWWWWSQATGSSGAQSITIEELERFLRSDIAKAGIDHVPMVVEDTHESDKREESKAAAASPSPRTRYLSRKNTKRVQRKGNGR